MVEAVTVAGGFGGGHSSGGFSGGGRSSGGFSSSGSSSSYRSSRPIYGGPHYHSGGYGYGYSSSSSWISILVFFIILMIIVMPIIQKDSVKIPKNTEVLVLDYNSNKSWAKVKYGNKTGWVSAKYLSDKPLKIEEEIDSYWDGVTKANLNLRKSPSTDGVIIVTIPKNSTVKIYKEEDGWLKVKYKSYEGYCSALYVR